MRIACVLVKRIDCSAMVQSSPRCTWSVLVESRRSDEDATLGKVYPSVVCCHGTSTLTVALEAIAYTTSQRAQNRVIDPVMGWAKKLHPGVCEPLCCGLI